jgi:hypothetical protein
MEEKQPWVTCYLPDMLLSYVGEALEAERRLDYPALFRGAEDLDIPSNLKSYLSDVDNWMPLSVLRELESQCEEISGKKCCLWQFRRSLLVISWGLVLRNRSHNRKLLLNSPSFLPKNKTWKS